MSVVLMIGILTCAFMLATIVAVALRVIVDCTRLGIATFLYKCHDSSHQGTTSGNNLKYRPILLGGLRCLRDFVQGVWLGFYNCLTVVDGIAYPQNYKYKQEGKKQACDLSHVDDCITAKGMVNQMQGEPQTLSLNTHPIFRTRGRGRGERVFHNSILLNILAITPRSVPLSPLAIVCPRGCVTVETTVHSTGSAFDVL